MGTVVEVLPQEHVVVEFEAQRCKNCQCGRMFATPPTELQLRVAQDSALAQQLDAPQVGQHVVLSVGRQHFSFVAGLLLGLPLVSGFVAVGCAVLAGVTLAWQGLALLVGVIAGSVGIRCLAGRLHTTVHKSLTIRTADL